MRTDTSGLPPLPNSLEEVRAMFRGEFDYARPGNDYYNANHMWSYGRACMNEGLTRNSRLSAVVPACLNCGNQGFTKTPDILDCSAPTCTAAERRTALDAAIKRHEQQLGEAMGRSELAWFAANWKAVA